jgi:hypothetical protein
LGQVDRLLGVTLGIAPDGIEGETGQDHKEELGFEKSDKKSVSSALPTYALSGP